MSEHPDFNILKNFFNNNIDSLIQITIKERKDKGFGALFMEVNHEKNNVDCRFINRETAYNTPGFKEIYDNLQSNHRPSVAFFVLVVFNKEKDTSEIQILNIDLDENRS